MSADHRDPVAAGRRRVSAIPRILFVFGTLVAVLCRVSATAPSVAQMMAYQTLAADEKGTGQPSPSPAQSFAGISPANGTPPDSHGAVGPNHVLTQVNGTSTVHDRNGNLLTSTTLTGFWASLGVTDVFDPRVLFDPHSNRFMVVACAQRRSSASGMLFGVTQTSDPTGNWFLWLLDADPSNTNWLDYPNIGVTANRITFTGNLFTISGDGFGGVDIWTVDKASALDGGSLTLQLMAVSNAGGTLVPALTYDASETTQYLIRVGTSNIFGSGRLQVYSITGNIGSLSFTINPFASIGSPWSISLPNAKQLGTTATIETNDDRLMNAVIRNGRLWTVHAVAFDTVTRDHSAIKWWEIVPSSGSVVQTGLIEDVDATGNFDNTKGVYYYFPSIAVNSTNNVLVGFSGSGALEYASSYYAYRPSTAGTGLFNEPFKYQAGAGIYTGPRWGDYSATVVDPVDDTTLWTVQEYASGGNKGGNFWAKVGQGAADTTKPRVSGAAASSSTSVRITFDETMQDNAALVNPASYTFNGGLTASSVTRLNTTQVSVAVGEMGNGASYTASVSTSGPTDVAGNTVSATGNTAAFTGLGSAPTAVIGLAGTNPTNLDTVEFSVNFNESVGSTFTAADVSVSGSLAPGAGVAVAGGAIQFTVRVTPSNPNAEGTIGITIGTGITDLAGNTFAGGSSPANYTVDNTAPSVGVNTLLTNDSTPPLSGTINDSSASISIAVGGQTRTATNNGNGTWTLANNALATLADNTYNVVATATDVAGNSSTDGTANELTIDATPPSVTVNSRVTNDNTPQLTGTVSEVSATVTIAVGGQTRTATNNGNGTWTLPDGALNALSDGVYNVAATATDSVGNMGTDSTTNELTVDVTAPAVTVTPLATNDTRPPLSGSTSDLSAPVSVLVGGQTRTATNNGNGTWTLADNAINPALAAGVYDVAVTSTDAAGNTGTDATANELTIDVTPPVVTVNSRITKDTTPSLTGTVNDMGAAISVSVGGQTRTATNNGNGTWTLADNSLNALAQGTYNVAVTATDAAGNSASDSTTNELVIDTTAPVVTVATLFTSDTTPPLSGTVNDATASISVAVNGQTRTATNNGSVWSLADGSLSALPQGTYNVAVTATDTAGNAGTDSTTNELTIDSTPPVITVNTLTTTDRTPPLTGTINDNTATIRVTVGSQVNLAATNNGNGTWTLPDNTLTTLSDGVYNVVASATDAAANTGSDGSTNELVVDATAPIVTVNTLVTNDSRPPLGGTVNDTTATISVSVGGQTRAAANNGNGTWTLADNAINPALANNTYNVAVTATDAAGNAGTDGTANELTVDTVAPAIAVTAKITKDTTPPLSGTVNDNSATISITVGGQTRTATNNGNGTWTLADGSLNALAQGTYNVAATATDPAGNAGTDSTTNELVIDTTAPVITVSTLTTTDNTPPLSGTVNDNSATISISVGGQTRTATNNGNGTWTLANNVLAALGDGTYNVAASATDLAGNTGTDATASELRIDTVVPAITVTPLSTADTTPPLGGTVSETGATISIAVNGQTRAATNNGNGTWSLGDNVLAALPNGAFNVAATATDAAGNAGTDTTSNELTIDNTAPSVTVSSLVTNNQRPVLTGTVDDNLAAVRVSVSTHTNLLAVNNANGTWTLPGGSITSDLAPGTYNVSASATDTLGNVGNDATTNELVIDLTVQGIVITVNSLATNDRTPPLTGTIDNNGAAIQVQVDGSTYNATNNGDGTWMLADNVITPQLPEGAYNVVASATNGGLSGTDTSNNELTIDLTAPTVTVNQLATQNTTPTLTGTTNTPNATIRVDVGGQNNLSATNNGNGTWTLNVPGALAQNTYNVVVRATDTAGNVGTDTTANELRVDVTAPTITVTPKVTGNNRPGLAGTVSDTPAGGTVAVSITVNGQTRAAVVSGGAWMVASGAFNTIPDGTYNVQGTATDQAGNVGNDGTAGELTVDTTAPVVGVDSLNTKDSTPPLTGTVNDNGATIRVTVGGQANVLATNNANGTWTLADGALTVLADGLYNVQVTAADSVGNTGTDATTDELRVDATAPAITVNPRVTNNSRPPLSGTVNDTAATIAITVSGNTYAALNNGNGTWTLGSNLITPALTSGTFSVTARATDTFGNIGTDPTANELVVDLVAPTIAVDNFLTNDDTPPLTGTVNDTTATITISVGSQTNLPAVNNGNGTWFLPDGTLTPLADGVYNVIASATDTAGNTGTDASTNELTINSQAPVITVNTLLTSNSMPPLGGTVDDPAATVTLTVGSQTGVAVTNNGDGTWSLAGGVLSALPDGVYNVIARAVDAQGNTSMDGTTNELTVDSTPPVVGVNTLLTKDNRPPLSGAINDATAAVRIAVNGQTGLAAANNGNGTWTLPDNAITISLPDNAVGYDVTATATDPVGNVGTDATGNELRIDTVAPTPAINNLTTNAASPPITGTVNDNFAQISVTVDGQTRAATNNSNGTWTLAAGQLAALSSGTYTVNVAATDLAGNTGNAALPNGLVVDVTPPAISVNALITTDTTPMLTGNVDDTTAVVSVTVGAQTFPATNNGNGTWTLPDNTLAMLADGMYDVVARATDTLGNVGTESTSNELTVDTSGPAVAVIPLITNDTTPALTGTISEAGVAISVTVAGNTYNALNNGDGTWILANDTITPPLTAGTYDVGVAASDGLGNMGADTSTDELVVDLTPPAVTVDTSLSILASPHLAGTVNDIFATVTVTVGGQTRTATNIGNGTWALVAGTLDPLASGVYDVAVEAADLAGNTASDSTTNELTVDVDAPAITVDALVTNDSTPPLSGTVDDPSAAIVVTVAGQTFDAVNNGDGTWGLADNALSPLDDGAYNVLAVATDFAGNISADPTLVDDLTIITEAPMISVLPLVTSDTTPQLNGLINQPSSTVTVTVGGQSFGAVNNGDGSWTLPDNTLSALPEGTYNVQAQAVDLLGNTGVDTTTNELAINANAPLVTVARLATRDRTPPLTGTVSVPGIPVSVSVGSQTLPATNNGDGTWTLADNSLAALDDGVYDVFVVAQGTVNGNDATINELTIDTLGPSLMVGGPSVAATQTGPISFNLHYGAGAQVGLLLSDVNTFALLKPNVAVLGEGRTAVQKTFPISTATASGIVSISGSGNAVRTVTVSEITGDGYLGIAIIGGTAVDASGNPAESAISTELCHVDNTAPKIRAAGVANLGILTVTFDEPMGDTALDPLNYTISGPGRGTLSANPDLVIRITPEKYRLVWSIGASVSGEEITITALNVTDAVTNLVGAENTINVLVEGIGVAPSVTGVAVQGAQSVAVQFSEPIDIGALEPENYTAGGSGRGTLGANPASVSELPLNDPDNPDVFLTGNRNSYLLTWDEGEMVQGGDITIAVSGIMDNSGDTIGAPASGTDAGAGIGVAPAVQSVKVKTGLTVEIVFTEAMGATALDAANYTIGGPGRGTLAPNPDSVSLTATGRYLLTWNAGEMVNGRDVTVTAANVFDLAGNPLGTPNSATDPKAGRDGLITVNMEARRDTTLYEDAAGNLANGAGTSFFAGVGGDGLLRRGLLFFDVAGNIPAGSTVLESILTLQSGGTAGNSTARDVSLLQVTQDWAEGDVNAGEPGVNGAQAAEGEATWVHTVFDTEFWTAPGGDFTPGARATTSVAGAGTYTWSSANVLADTQSWLDDPDNNFGWLLLGDESTGGTVKQFASDESASAGARPVLAVVYSLNGGPGGPVLGTIGDQTVDEGQMLELELTAVDTGNNPLVLSAALSSLPPASGAQLADGGDGTATFRWTPTFVDSGSYVVTFIATQSGISSPLSTSETIVIDVAEVNQAPSFTNPGTLQATEGQLFTFAPAVTDNDANDTLSYSLTASLGDAAVDPDTGTLTWTPGYSDAGDHSIGLLVTDSGAPALSATLQLQVAVADANGPPVLTPIGDQVVVERESLSFTAMATDPDLSDTLAFSLENAPAGAGIDPATGRFTWTPNIIAAGQYAVTFTVTDDGEPSLSDSETVTVAVVDDNQNPTNIALTPSNVMENLPAGTAVGKLTTVDPDAGDAHVYTLADGSGDTDNADFSIAGDELRTNRSFNFEARSSYSVRVQTFDGKDGTFARALTVSIVNGNDPPQSIALSNSSVTENVPAGTAVGTLTTADEDASTLHTYTLVSGEGDTSNALFAINGDRLVTNGAIDYETQTSHSVRVRSADPAGAAVEAVFTIAVDNVNDTPDGVTLSNQRIDENRPAGTPVGEFMTDDADNAGSHSYSLVAGDGATDNAQFRIQGTVLQTAQPLDFERSRFRSIRVRTNDGQGQVFEMVFQIEVVNVNDTPSDIALSTTGILNNVPADTKIGDLSTIDQDVSDTHTYGLVSGDGSGDNSRFKIANRALFTAEQLNFDSSEQFNVRIRTTDAAGATFEKAFVLTNDDVDGDGMSDTWERANFGNLDAGPGEDPDQDGLTNLQEFQQNTNPKNADSDGDGVSDGVEVSLGSDPRNGADAPASLRVTPSTLTIGRDEGTLTLTVRNMGVNALNWRAEVVAGDFVEIVSGQTGSNMGQISLAVTANGSAASRAATLRVTATNASGSPVDIPLTQSACSAPGVPEDVVASNGTLAGQVRITWDAVPGADRYMVYRSLGTDPAAAELLDTITGTAYTDITAEVLDPAKQDAGNGCILLPPSTPEANAYQYWVRATSVCGTSGFSQPDGGFPGAGQPPARKLYEPVMPAAETANRTLTARVDSTLAIRLRRDTGINPSSISGMVEFAGGSRTDVEWLAIDKAGLTDGWALFTPGETPFALGDTVSFTVSASTVSGESIGPLNFTFTVETEEMFLERIGASMPPIAQPAYTDFDASGIDLSLEGNDLVSVYALDAATAPAPPGGAVGPAYAIGPDEAYRVRQRVWIPIPDNLGAGDVVLNYYFADKTGSETGWYPAETIQGWLVQDSYLELELNGVRYLGFLARHAGLVQVSAASAKAETVADASALPLPFLAKAYGGDGIVLLGILLGFLFVLPRVAGRRPGFR